MEVLGAKRLRGLEHRPKQAVGARKGAHGRDQAIIHAGHQEPAEATFAIGNPKCRKAGSGELAGAVDKSLQDLINGQLRRDREDRIADGPEGRAQPLAHGIGQYGGRA